MKAFWKVLFIVYATDRASCTIAGLTFMDSLAQKHHNSSSPNGEDPCNPLFWYPKNIPDYCYFKTTSAPGGRDKRPDKKIPLPIPIPVPVPPRPVPVPVLRTQLPTPELVPPPALPPQSLMPIPAAVPIPIPPIPYGIPLSLTNPMLPIFPQPYPLQPYPLQPYPAFPSFPSYPIPPIYQQGPPAGFVPGLPGFVSRDGGINILPFTDVYSDMLAKHKEKMMRKEFKRIMEKYESNLSKNVRWKPYRWNRYE